MGGDHLVGGVGGTSADHLLLSGGVGRLCAGSLQASRWQDAVVAAVDRVDLDQRTRGLRDCLHTDAVLRGWRRSQLADAAP